MGCDFIKTAGGGGVIICRGRAYRVCEFCGHAAELQCDFPIEGMPGRKTCDRWMCRSCGTSQGPNIDYCPPHERNKLKIMEARLRSKQGESNARRER